MRTSCRISATRCCRGSSAWACERRNAASWLVAVRAGPFYSPPHRSFGKDPLRRIRAAGQRIFPATLARERLFMSIVLYGIGSPFVVELEETCARLRLTLVGAVKNVDGPVHAISEVPIYLSA